MGLLPVMLNDHVRRNPGSLSAEIDGEVVALDVLRGTCYGLDPIGARIWSMLERPIIVERLCVLLCAEFDVDTETCREDVLGLLNELYAEDLILVGSPQPRET